MLWLERSVWRVLPRRHQRCEGRKLFASPDLTFPTCSLGGRDAGLPGDLQPRKQVDRGTLFLEANIKNEPRHKVPADGVIYSVTSTDAHTRWEPKV